VLLVTCYWDIIIKEEKIENMSYFFIGVNILFFATLLFYIVFFSLVYYWHVKKTSFVVVPIIFTFEFFLIGFLILSIVLILIEYVPKILILFG